MDGLPDTSLMCRVKEGDLQAFDALYERHHAGLRRFVFSLVWDDDMADDLVQETFVRLYRARSRYEPTGRFTTFLFQIAKNLYLMHRRRQARQHQVSVDGGRCSAAPALDRLAANARVEPEVHLMEAYGRWRIRRAIDALPDGQKLVFVMSHLEDMRYGQIAEVLGIPEGTVKSRMFAAVKALRTKLKEEAP